MWGVCEELKTGEGLEVDFLVGISGEDQELIQVCADASDPDTARREFRALRAAGERYAQARRRLLTLTRDGFPAEAPAETVVQPAYEWMLSDFI